MHNILNIITVLLIITIGGSIMISLIMSLIEKDKENLFNLNTYSAWIGYLERIFIYIMLIYGYLNLIMVIIAMKSVIRYPEINSKSSKLSAEKFLFGTLFSVTYTIIIYYLYQQI